MSGCCGPDGSDRRLIRKALLDTGTEPGQSGGEAMSRSSDLTGPAARPERATVTQHTTDVDGSRVWCWLTAGTPAARVGIGHEFQWQAPARWTATLLRGGVLRMRTRSAPVGVDKRGDAAVAVNLDDRGWFPWDATDDPGKTLRRCTPCPPCYGATSTCAAPAARSVVTDLIR